MALNIGDDYCPNNTTDSFGKFPNWLFKADLSDQAKIMWCKLSQYARDKESCFPKQETLATELNMSRWGVMRSLDELKNKGCIRTERRKYSLYYIFTVTKDSIHNSRCLSTAHEMSEYRTSGNGDNQSESLQKDPQYLGRIDTLNRSFVSSSFVQSESLQTLPSHTEEDYNAISSPCVVPQARRLNRGNEDLPTKAFPIVRKLSRGDNMNSSTVSEKVEAIPKLSAYDLIKLKQAEEDLTPPTMGGARGVSTVDAGKKRISTQALALLKYWNLHSGARKHKLPSPGEAPTNTVTNSSKLIKKLLKGQAFLRNNGGSFTEIVTKTDIEEAIDLFHEVVTNPDVFPAKKDYVSNLGFPQFIYDNYTGASYFLKCFNKEIIANSTLIFKDETTREVYEELKKSYDSYFKQERDYSLSDLRKIRTGADLLLTKINEIADKVFNYDTQRSLDDPDLWTDWTMESLLDHFGKSVSIGNLSSRYTYDVCLIRYLEKKGRLRSSKEKDPEYKMYDEEEETMYRGVDPSELVGQPVYQIEEY